METKDGKREMVLGRYFGAGAYPSRNGKQDGMHEFALVLSKEEQTRPSELRLDIIIVLVILAVPRNCPNNAAPCCICGTLFLLL